MTIAQSPKPFEKSRRQDGQYALLDQLERIQTWAHRAHRARERSRETAFIGISSFWLWLRPAVSL